MIRYNLSYINKIRNNLNEKLRPYYNTQLDGESFPAFVTDIHSVLPSVIARSIIIQSIMNLVGTELTKEMLNKLSWRLAGNIQKLKEGKPVLAWIRQTELEWCPVTILDAQSGKNFKGDLGGFYKYKILGGSPAGLTFTLFWSRKYSKFLSRSLGFKRTRKLYYKFSNIKELVSMRLYLLFDPALSKDDKPRANKFYVPASFLKYNQTILARRFRITPCPLNYKLSELPCYKCPMGYDKCTAGCHSATYIIKVCPRCEKENWFDPKSKSVICINCEDNR